MYIFLVFGRQRQGNVCDFEISLVLFQDRRGHTVRRYVNTLKKLKDKSKERREI